MGIVTTSSDTAFQTLATGFSFGEGPRWFEGLLWFSDMLGAAVHTVDLRGSLTTVPLPGHAPSGLGFRPDGSLLIASTEARQVLRYDGEAVTTIADLSAVAPADLGDMVVDDLGRAYIGSQAFHGGPARRSCSCCRAPTPTPSGWWAPGCPDSTR